MSARRVQAANMTASCIYWPAMIDQMKIGQAFAGWTELVSTITCTPFLNFVECYKAKSNTWFGRSGGGGPFAGGRPFAVGHHPLNKTLDLLHLNVYFYSPKYFVMV